jgi:uncharacterized protein YgiM (DUF1202 family)
MRRVVLVAALAALIPTLSAADATAPAPSLAPAPAASPDALAAGAGSDSSVRVTLSKNGNVRFAPTTQSKVIVTLPGRSEVEILGPAKVAGWYVIRFPHEGSAWVHQKVLQAVDGGKRWRVTEDKARARDDSTLGGGIVCELAKGEIVEDKGRLNGDWRAVYLPNAVAYISGSVLDMPADLGIARTKSGERAKEAATVWTNAQAVYASYYDALQKNPQNALVLDWDGLSKAFDQVIHDHADPDVRTSAQRLRDGIVNVAAAAANLQKAKGITPVKVPSDIALLSPTPATGTTTAAPQPVPGKVTDAGDILKPPSLTVPGEQPAPTVLVPPVEIGPKPTPAPQPVAATKAFAAEGFVTQQKFEGLGVSEVLVDGDSNVVAFLQIKVGKDIQLSEYYWRWVGVRGEVQQVDPAKHTLGRNVPLVIVEDLSLSGR